MSVDNLEFLNENSLRNFPIHEGLSRISNEGVTIPNDFLVDASFAVSSNVTSRIYISKINNFGSSISVEFSDESDVLIGNIVIDASTFTGNKDYTLQPSTAYTAAIGRVTVGSITNWDALPTGTFTFPITTTELESRTVVPSLSGMNRLTFKNASGTTFSATGNVIIESRVNLKFTYDSVNNKVLLDAGEDIGLNTLCTAEQLPILTINGVAPDSAGNFILDFASCALISVLPSGTGLLLNDVCCKPCVGCEELGTLTSRLMSLESNLITLRNNYVALLQTFDNFKTAATLTCACS